MAKDYKQLYKTTRKQKTRIDILRTLRITLLATTIIITLLIFVVRPVRIRGNSMHPTLRNGDIGISNILFANLDNMSRFDIVTVDSKSGEHNIEKRIIGLPGETVEYKDDKLFINNKEMKEDFLDKEYVKQYLATHKGNFTKDFGPYKLKENEYFLVGDNRPISKDSRTEGAYSSKDFIGVGFFKIF